MPLVTPKHIVKVLNLQKLGFFANAIGWLVFRLMGLKKINQIYHANKNKTGISFLEAVLKECNVEFEISEEDLKRIPKKGAFITVSNHPLGGVDGLLLLKIILKERSDFKIIANFLLDKIEPLKNYIFPVNPFETRKDIKSSVLGIKEALIHLKKGNPLGIFPAGEVSTKKKGKIVLDKPWEIGAIKLIKKAKVPVVPIYFHTKNSNLFYILSKIDSSLRTAKLPSEIKSKNKKIIKIRIGKPITLADQNKFTSTNDLNIFLRKKTYLLAKPFENYQNISSKKKATKKILAAKTDSLILHEINALKVAQKKILESKNYEVYFAKAEEIPNILQEIGRLREITFRAVGEGTNTTIDIDKYDNYYRHLFLWDTKENNIAGAYRVGLGKEIYSKIGIKGFYIQTLFKIDIELHTIMQNTIEMGRAFVVKKYQQKPMPLFLLWKGIIHITLQYPKYKYLMGPVSISNNFSDFSKSLMIMFMKIYYYDNTLAKYIHPQKEYNIKLEQNDKDFILENSNGSLQLFDRVIEEIEPDGLRIPVLIKKYIKQNARFLGFNVDPKFNNAIDGLMYIKITDIPENTIKPVLENFKSTEKKT